MTPEDSAQHNGPARMRLLVGASGSANVVRLPDYLVTLRSIPGCTVCVLMTTAARAILSPATVQLFCDEVFCDGPDSFSPGHVRLASWADKLIVLPSTARMLGQAAHGLANGLLASTLLAYSQPVVFFPSMNKRMWQQPSVQRNVQQLRADGHHVVEPTVARGWEIATSAMQVNPGLPTPTEVAELVRSLTITPRDEADTAAPVSLQRSRSGYNESDWFPRRGEKSLRCLERY